MSLPAFFCAIDLEMMSSEKILKHVNCLLGEMKDTEFKLSTYVQMTQEMSFGGEKL
jgi:hypothetical protein